MIISDNYKRMNGREGEYKHHSDAVMRLCDSFEIYFLTLLKNLGTSIVHLMFVLFWILGAYVSRDLAQIRKVDNQTIFAAQVKKDYYHPYVLLSVLKGIHKVEKCTWFAVQTKQVKLLSNHVNRCSSTSWLPRGQKFREHSPPSQECLHQN